MNQLHAKFGDKGLTIVAAECQGTTPDDIRKSFPQITYPVISGGVGGYSGSGGIPHCWVIGVDGKVIFEGNPHSMGNVIEDEMKKINYPGLGKLDVHAKAANAAKLFSSKNYGKARDEAQKLVDKLAKDFDDGKIDAEKLKDDDKVLFADATFILERVSKTAAELKEKATKYETDRLYLHAQRTWTAIITAFGKKSDEGSEASDKVKAYSKDKDIKKEILAYMELEKVQESWKGKTVRADKFNAEMDKIVRSFEGTKAAEVAEASKIADK